MAHGERRRRSDERGDLCRPIDLRRRRARHPRAPSACRRPPKATSTAPRCRGPLAIGLIDGYFERVPAVWHKEILWALSQGIHVFGSASMGALRAAELAPFGMIGVGAIFEAYRDGILEDDDEVAVAHGPADTGYRAGSDAMVNIRATLARAVQHGRDRRHRRRRHSSALAKGCSTPSARTRAFSNWPGRKGSRRPSSTTSAAGSDRARSIRSATTRWRCSRRCACVSTRDAQPHRSTSCSRRRSGGSS